VQPAPTPAPVPAPAPAPAVPIKDEQRTEAYQAQQPVAPVPASIPAPAPAQEEKPPAVPAPGQEEGFVMKGLRPYGSPEAVKKEIIPEKISAVPVPIKTEEAFKPKGFRSYDY